MNPKITSIGIAYPEYLYSQSEIADFMIRSMNLTAEEKKKVQVLYRATGIRQRYSVIPDYNQLPHNYKFFPDNENLEPFPTTSYRMQWYKRKALPLSIQAVHDCLPKQFSRKDISHLITVSCTGMYAPGLDIDLVKQLQLSPHVQRTCVNYMGCYAAFNALKLAAAICKGEPEAKVLVVSVELSSLHFQKEKQEDFVLANALFADGAAAALVENKWETSVVLQMEKFHADLVPEGVSDMAWKIGDHGFEMRLSARVPQIIKSGIGKLVERLTEKNDRSLKEIEHFAIHPGGKRILDVIEDIIDLNDHQKQPGRQILRNYGNMSSATILFVLHHIMYKTSDIKNNDQVMALAFGPGLTLESMLLKLLTE